MNNYPRVVDKETSVKALGIIQEPTPGKTGVFDFIYSDQYSILDWGKMPMPAGKEMDNRPVALTGAFNHELLRAQGIPVCYLGTVGSDGATHDMTWFREHREVSRTLRMRMVNIIKPTFNLQKGKWDYSVFQNPPANNYVHPIEFIWRKEAGPDSIFWKNVAKGAYKLSDFGLPETLKTGAPFPEPVLDHSSKYEDHDRYFSPKTARQLVAIPTERWAGLCRTREEINKILFLHARDIGIYRPDAKQEFLSITEPDGTIVDMLADVAGTWHEDRFEYTTREEKIVKVSKQTPRDLNKLLNPEWAKQCEEAKARAEREGHPNWKAFVTEMPLSLEPLFFDQYNNLMRAATNEWVGWNAFPEASGLEEACREFDLYLTDYKKRL